MVDVKVALFDGSYHEVDSNENAFKIAGSLAFKEAAHRAKPVLLEPVMAVEVTVPEEFMGTIIGDINSRRGGIEGMEHVSGSQVIRPWCRLLSFSVRAAAVGQEYSVQFARYKPVPSRGIEGDESPTFAIKPRGPKPKNHSASVGPDGE